MRESHKLRVKVYKLIFDYIKSNKDRAYYTHTILKALQKAEITVVPRTVLNYLESLVKLGILKRGPKTIQENIYTLQNENLLDHLASLASEESLIQFNEMLEHQSNSIRREKRKLEEESLGHSSVKKQKSDTNEDVLNFLNSILNTYKDPEILKQRFAEKTTRDLEQFQDNPKEYHKVKSIRESLAKNFDLSIYEQLTFKFIYETNYNHAEIEEDKNRSAACKQHFGLFKSAKSYDKTEFNHQLELAKFYASENEKHCTNNVEIVRILTTDITRRAFLELENRYQQSLSKDVVKPKC